MQDAHAVQFLMCKPAEKLPLLVYIRTSTHKNIGIHVGLKGSGSQKPRCMYMQE